MSLSLAPETAGTMSMRVQQALRDAIVQLAFEPGHLLSEAEIARELGVSRQPVREAFIKLGEAGLLEIRPQRGSFVKLISVRDVENARFVREAIETAVVRRAAASSDAAAIARLRANLAAQAAENAATPARFLALDEAFHQLIADMAGAAYAWHVVESLKAQMDRVRYLAMPGETPTAVLVAQHTAIVDALERGDADAAADAMQAHLGEILTSLPRLAATRPELFSA